MVLEGPPHRVPPLTVDPVDLSSKACFSQALFNTDEGSRQLDGL